VFGGDDDDVDLGSLLRGYRERSGLTQAGLAGRAGLSERGLRDLERGRSRRPHLTSIQRLAEAMDLTPDERALLLRRNGGPVTPAFAPPAAVPAPGGPAPGVPAPGGPARGGPAGVGILGPLSVTVDARPVHAGTPMLRTLLGLLALHAPDTVPVDEIMAELWGDRPPRTARAQVNVRVGQLRRLLGSEACVESSNGGYRLRTALDASTFTELVTAAERARADGDHDGAGAHYATALRLWRGPVLADVPGLRYHPVVAGLTARRITATIAHADRAGPADLPEVLGWLRALADDEPLHEGLAASLMLGLAATGDRAAALAVHAATRERLRAELGIEPGPELRAAHRRVLEREAEPPPAEPAAAPSGADHLIRLLAAHPDPDVAAACAHARQGRYDAALAHLDLAARRHRDRDDPAGHARVILGRGWVAGLLGDGREALAHTERALAMFEGLGDRLGIAHALAGAGRHLAGLGEADRALGVLTRAWTLHRDLDDPYGRADTLDRLGGVYLLKGRPEAAAGHFRRAAALHRELGDRYAEADSRHWLGDAHDAMGDLVGARSAWSSALRILDDMGHADAAGLRDKLTRTRATPAPTPGQTPGQARDRRRTAGWPWPGGPDGRTPSR
jgi:DNA-binding SARP family transcriptional activator/DNA-binding XRE family transcriptional regulator